MQLIKPNTFEILREEVAGLIQEKLPRLEDRLPSNIIPIVLWYAMKSGFELPGRKWKLNGKGKVLILSLK